MRNALFKFLLMAICISFLAQKQITAKRDSVIFDSDNPEQGNKIVRYYAPSMTSLAKIGHDYETLNEEDPQSIFKDIDSESDTIQNDNEDDVVTYSIGVMGSVWPSEQYTKEDGSYNFSYNDIWYIGDGKFRLTLYAEGEAIKVYSSDNSTIILEKTFDGGSGNYYFSSTFDPKNDEPSQRITILEEGNAFAEQTKSVNNGEYFLTVAIKYFPETIGTTNYSIGKDTIYLLKDEKRTPTKTGYPSIYASWDVIGHE